MSAGPTMLVRRRRHGIAMAIGLALVLLVPAGPGGQGAGRPPRTASYEIDATLDTAAHTLNGHEVIRWRNPGPLSAYSVRLHFYWNAWRNSDSSFLRQLRLAGLERDLASRRPADFGWQEPSEIRLINADGSDGRD